MHQSVRVFSCSAIRRKILVCGGKCSTVADVVWMQDCFLYNLSPKLHWWKRLLSQLKLVPAVELIELDVKEYKKWFRDFYKAITKLEVSLDKDLYGVVEALHPE